MFVYVCRGCGAVHTEDWFRYAWKKVFQRDTGLYRLVKEEEREEMPEAVECRVCGGAVYRHSVPTALDGLFEVPDNLPPVSEDEYGQLYFLGHDVSEPDLPLVAVPVSRRVAEAVARKVHAGCKLLRLVAGKDTVYVFGASAERPSDRLLERKQARRPARQQDDRTGILAYT